MIEDPTSKGIAQWCADNKSFASAPPPSASPVICRANSTAVYSPQRFEDGLLRKYFSELDLQAFFGKVRRRTAVLAGHVPIEIAPELLTLIPCELTRIYSFASMALKCNVKPSGLRCIPLTLRTPTS